MAKKEKTIDIVCRNSFPNDPEVLVKETGEKDLSFFSEDPQLIEVVKAKVAVALKRGRIKKVIVNNKTKGSCEITVEKFADFTARRDKMLKEMKQSET